MTDRQAFIKAFVLSFYNPQGVPIEAILRDAVTAADLIFPVTEEVV